MAKTLHATATLIGTIIGAGIFGIPFVVMQSGFGIGMLHIVVIAIMMMITMLYLGEIALRTKKNLHLTGYAEKYLGTKGKIIMLVSLISGIYAAILAYLIGIGESLSFLFFGSGIYTLQLGIAFWIVLSLFSLMGLKALEQGEFIGVAAILLLILGIAAFFVNKIDISNLAQDFTKSTISYFAPFGVILFAFLGYTTIPEVKRILAGHKGEMKRSIILANIVSAIVYIIFTLIVIGVKGLNTPEIATVALGKPFLLLGIFTMSTSYLALSIALIDSLKLDFSQTKAKAWLYTIIIPLILFIILALTKSAKFTKVLGIGGVITGGLTSILIFFMASKAKYLGDRIPEYSIPVSKILIWTLIAIFAAGTITELINAF